MAMSSFEWMELQTLTSDIDTARSRLADARKRRDHGRIRALEDEITRAEKRRLQLVAHISTNIATGEEPTPIPRARGASATAEPAAEAETPSPASADEEPSAVEAAAPEPEAAEEAVEAVAVETAEETTEAASETAETVAEEPSPETPESEAPEPEPEPAPRRRAKEAAAAEEPAETADQPEAAAPSPEPQLEDAAAAALRASASATSAKGGTMAWDQLTPNDIERAKRDIGVRRAEMLSRHAEELKSLEAEQSQIDLLEQAIGAFMQKFTGAAEGAVVKLDQERELRQQGGN